MKRAAIGAILAVAFLVATATDVHRNGKGVVRVAHAQKGPAVGLQYFLLVTGISGESVVVPGAIDVTSYSTGVTLPTAPIGRAQFDGLTVTANVTSASPLLIRDTASGRIVNATLIGRRGDGEEMLRYTLEQTSVVRVQPAGRNGDSTAVEATTFGAPRILRTSVRLTNPDGTLGDFVNSCWDFVQVRICT